MQFTLSLALPRDALSIPVVRAVLADCLHALGVAPGCVDDIRVAISEACTNVLDHAVEGDDYEVVATIDESICSIEVVDRGTGFDSLGLSPDAVADEAESGRGIRLMRALVDSVTFAARTKGGTVVCLEKELSLQRDAPIRRLRSPHPGRDGPASHVAG